MSMIEAPGDRPPRRPRGVAANDVVVPLAKTAETWHTPPPSPPQPSNAEVTDDVKAALRERLGYLAERLGLEVGERTVLLRGEVESGNQKTIAEETARARAGARSVSNRIRVLPPSKLAMRPLYR